MQLTELISKLKEYAAEVPSIHTITTGIVYNNWNTHEIKYGAFNICPNTVKCDGDTIVHSLTLYFGDVLDSDGSNEYINVDNGVIAMEYVLIKLMEEFDIDITDGYTYNIFNQTFADTLSGVWVDIEFRSKNNIDKCNMP